MPRRRAPRARRGTGTGRRAPDQGGSTDLNGMVAFLHAQLQAGVRNVVVHLPKDFPDHMNFVALLAVELAETHEFIGFEEGNTGTLFFRDAEGDDWSVGFTFD